MMPPITKIRIASGIAKVCNWTIILLTKVVKDCIDCSFKSFDSLQLQVHHRGYVSVRVIPTRCLHWRGYSRVLFSAFRQCRGEPVRNSEVHALPESKASS